MRLSVPVELVDPGEPRLAEDAVTENVSPCGVRVLVKTPVDRDALLLLKSPAPRFRTSVRVVYCEPVTGGQFGVGLQLQGTSVNWTENITDVAAD
jgi:hypothetical protein